MLTMILGLTAASMPLSATAVPSIAAPAPIAAAATADYSTRRRYAYREWRGRDGRLRCRRPDGTTGLVIGAAAGALVGRSIDRRGDRTGGTLLGAIAGGLAGREIERSGTRRCR